LLKRLPNIPGLLKLTFAALFFILLTSQKLYAQEKPKTSDTTEYHSPKKAAIMSAVLPGLGQGYNKKYWKIPIIYAGFGTLIYFIHTNGTEYRNFRDAYNIVSAGDSANYMNNSYVVRYNANLNQLQQGRNYYRRNLELSYILSGALYILQILDASVDANLYDFDVSDDITLRFEPVMSDHYLASRPTPGLTLRFKF
jgi:hypothetical protein